MPKVTINVPLLGGIDLLHDPAAISDEKVVETANMFPTISGQLEKRAAMTIWRPNRPGFPNIQSYLSNDPLQAVSGLHCTGAKIPFDFVFTVNLIAVPGTVRTRPDGPANVNIGITNNARPRFIEFNNSVIILPNNDNQSGIVVLRFNTLTNLWELTPYNFTTVSPAVPVITNNLYPKCAAPYLNSVVWGNLGAGYELSLLFGDDALQADFNAGGQYIPRFGIVPDQAIANQRYIDLVGGEGSNITAMTEIQIANVGQLLQAGLLVLTEFDAFVVTGRPENSYSIAENKLGTFNATRFQYRIGCVAQETVQRTPFGLIWASHEDVWLMQGLSPPVAIGTFLRPFLLNLPPELRWAWHAVYESTGVYRLVLPTQSTLTTFSAGNEANDLTYVEFWLDLRDGIQQARWFGPMEYKPWAGGGGVFAVQGPRASWKKPGQAGQTLCPVRTQDVYDVANVYGGFRSVVADVSSVRQVTVPPYDAATSTFASSVWQASSVYNQGDVVRPRIFNGNYFVCTTAGTTASSEPAFPTGSGSSIGDGSVVWTEWRGGGTQYGYRITDFGADHAVLMDLKTKNYSMGDTHVDKTFVKAEVEAFASKPAYLKLDVIQEDGAVTEQANAQMSQADGMVAGGVFGTLQEMFQNRSMRPTDTLRIVSKRQQYELFDGTEYVVDASNNTLYLGFYTNGNKSLPAADILPVVITPGLYADATALRAALQAALRAIVDSSPTLAGSTAGALWPGTSWLDWSVGVDAQAGNAQMLHTSVVMPVNPLVWTCDDALLTAAQAQVGAACMGLFGMEEWPAIDYGADTRWWSTSFEYVYLTAQQGMFSSNIVNWKLTDLAPTVDFHGKRPFTKGQAK